MGQRRSLIAEQLLKCADFPMSRPMVAVTGDAGRVIFTRRPCRAAVRNQQYRMLQTCLSCSLLRRRRLDSVLGHLKERPRWHMTCAPWSQKPRGTSNGLVGRSCRGHGMEDMKPYLRILMAIAPLALDMPVEEFIGLVPSPAGHTSTPAGKALFQMLGVFAEFERAIIVGRVHAGLR